MVLRHAYCLSKIITILNFNFANTKKWTTVRLMFHLHRPILGTCLCCFVQGKHSLSYSCSTSGVLPRHDKVHTRTAFQTCRHRLADIQPFWYISQTLFMEMQSHKACVNFAYIQTQHECESIMCLRLHGDVWLNVRPGLQEIQRGWMQSGPTLRTIYRGGNTARLFKAQLNA